MRKEDKDRWFTMSLAEQLGNVGSEVGRAVRWHNQGNLENQEKALTRAYELLDLTILYVFMKYLRQIKNLADKRVLMRVDFNVGLKDGKIKSEDALKIEKTLPTIKYLVHKKAKVILMAHLGRPEGIDLKLSLEPVKDFVEKQLGQKIKFLKIVKLENYLSEAEKESKNLQKDEILLLENIRFFAGEEKNDQKFGKELSKLGDIYVNEAFGVSHRQAASVCAVTKYLPSYTGLLLEQEIKALSYLLNKPKKPVVAIMGGLKFETKIPLIKKILPKADYILLGGGLSSTSIATLGYSVGGSKIDKDYFKEVKAIVKNKKIKLPIDFVVGNGETGDHKHVYLPSKKGPICNKSSAILDVGPATLREWAKIIKIANTLVWNGPVGYFEKKPFDHGTRAVALLVGARSKGRAYGVTGGGETLAALERSKMTEYIDHVSTGGGAMLEFLSGKKLPGLAALK